MTVRHELRGLLADHLRSWSVTLQGWAFRLDPDDARTGPLVAAHEDAERASASMFEAEIERLLLARREAIRCEPQP